MVLISIDGMRPDAIAPDRTPSLWALRQRGAWGIDVLNDLPSATLPNHATMLTGVTGARHGLIANFELPGTIETTTIFQYAARAGKRAAFFASKSKLRFLAPTQVLEVVDIDGELTPLVDRFIAALGSGNGSESPDLLFLHLREPDSTGHAAGWMSEPYLAAVAEVDDLVGRIITALDLQQRPTWILITADHGGSGTNHFTNIPENRTVPLIVAGPGIPPGAVIPNAATVDLTPTALELLGIDIPDGIDGRVLPLQILDSGSAAMEQVHIGAPCALLPVTVFALLIVRILRWPTPISSRRRVRQRTRGPTG